MGLFAVGVGWIVASLHVFLRDTAQVLSVMLTFWFWVTPIFIEEGKFPQCGEVLAARQSAVLRGAVLPGYSAAFRAAKFPGPGDLSGLWSSRSLWWAACSSAT